MTYGQLLSQILCLFTAIGFIYHILNKNTKNGKQQRSYTVKKVPMTPERAAHINRKKARRNKTQKPANYIEACWDEVNKI